MVLPNRACIRSRAFARFAHRPLPFQSHHQRYEGIEHSSRTSPTTAEWQTDLPLPTIEDAHDLHDDETLAAFPPTADVLQNRDTTTGANITTLTISHPLCFPSIQESLQREITMLSNLCLRFTWISRRARC
jgi:hypothetical protein